MARAQANKLYRNFVKGLITEASPLTFPENSMSSMDNVVLFKQGNIARRVGIDYEDGYALSSFSITAAEFATYAFKEYRWESVNNDSETKLLVNQVGPLLHFFSLHGEETGTALSASYFPSYTIDLTTFALDGFTTTVGNYEVSMISGKGYLFVVGQKIEPFMIIYDPLTLSLSTQQIFVQIRDFKGLDDGLANDEEPLVLSPEHEYNLLNQGWSAPENDGTGAINVTFYGDFGARQTYTAPPGTPIDQYHTAIGRYPGNNKQWWVGKASIADPTATPAIALGDFVPSYLVKFYNGNTHAPKGHFLVEAFNIDRVGVSGITALSTTNNEIIPDRPNAVSFFAGRVWYGLNSTVYFSQTLDDKRRAGFCYQEADPTSEDISDLIATDGGVIPIPEAHNIRAFFPAGFGILVFAENGVWYISGTTSGFTATDLAVSKVCSIGTRSPNSIVEAEGVIYWWSKTGIQAMTQKSGAFGAIDGKFDSLNITDTTIQNFYRNQIPEEAKLFAKAVYDPATNIIQWIWKAGGQNDYTYNSVLNFDINLKCFFPWSISSAVGRPFVIGTFLSPTNTLPYRSTFIKYLVAVPDTALENYTITAASFNDSSFVDWATFREIADPNIDKGYNYSSFVETGYEILEDTMREKQALYVFLYFRRTEQNYEHQTSGDYVFDTPSSCHFQVKWDWSSSQVSNKWTTQIEAYRLTRSALAVSDDLSFDTGFPIVVTKNKVRGNGRAIQFRFENDKSSSDFDLLGWAVPFSGNTNP